MSSGLAWVKQPFVSHPPLSLPPAPKDTVQTLPQHRHEATPSGSGQKPCLTQAMAETPQIPSEKICHDSSNVFYKFW